MRIGIDVGGTNTDAVLLVGQETEVRAAVKTPTTPDVTAGVVTAITELLGHAPAGFTPGAISAVMIGTTHFTNAVVEARRLTPTAVVRLGLPATAALPPLTGWPDRLRTAVGDRWYLCHGGYEYDGAELAPLRPDELRRVAADIAAAGVSSVAVSSVFAPVNGTMEVAAAEILRSEVPGLRVSCSHEFGRIGLLERENATVLNAALVDLAAGLVDALTAALADAGIAAPLLLSQNDGTLMGIAYGRRFPAATFASGPTNSMRGAGFLSGVADCAVIDVGGTTTDIGILTGGFPRETATFTEIAGIRTNWRMPDVLSLGIGGGSRVRHFSDGGRTEVGPDSVGFELTSKALVFGGEVLTLTDVAVAAEHARIGDTTALVRRLDPERAHAVLATAGERVADAVDRMRTSPDPLPVILVGGGSVVLPATLPGLPDVRRPEHADVANAIGAAIAKVGGELDRVVRITDGTREHVLAEAKAEAVARAESAGARSGSVAIVEIDEVPLAYLPGGATRVRVKAAGGVADGRGLAAVLALGADAAWVGTRFLLAAEAGSAAEYRALIASAAETDTAHGVVFDIGWPAAPHRALRNSTVRAWESAGRPAPGARPGEGEVVGRWADGRAIPRYADIAPVAEVTGSVEAMALYAGQGVGLVHEVRPAAEIVAEMCAEAERVFARFG